MARNEIYLQLDTPSFLSATLRPDTEGYSRSIVSDSSVTLQGFTPNGTPRFSGPAPSSFNRRYSWTINAQVTEFEAYFIEGMVRTQAPGNYVRLQDEFDWIEPEPFPASKSFVPGAPTSILNGLQTGFIEANVWLVLPEEHKRRLGGIQPCLQSQDNVLLDFTFTALEIP